MMKNRLNDPTLFTDCAWIGGEWIAPDRGAAYPVHNPATGETLAYVPDMGASATRKAIEAAHRAFPAWRSLSAGARALLCFAAGPTSCCSTRKIWARY